MRTYFVVSDPEGVVLTVEDSLTMAQEECRRRTMASGERRFLHTIVCSTAPKAGQSISMKNVGGNQ